MQPAGKDQANIPGRPSPPFLAAPHSHSGSVGPPGAPPPFSSSGPVGVPGASPFLSSGSPAVGTQPSSYRIPPPSIKSNGPTTTTTSFAAQGANTYQQSQAIRFPAVTQPSTPLQSTPPFSQPYMTSPTGSFPTQSQIPAVPMAQGLPLPTSRSNVPQPSLFTAPRTPPPPSLHGYSNVAQQAIIPPFQPGAELHASGPVSQSSIQSSPTTRVPPTHASPYQSLVPPPPRIGGTMGYSAREQMHHPLTGPPIGNVQGLAEEFQSLSVGSVPGTLNPGVDVNLLQRPLNGDEEPTKVLEMYPFNCHPRFLRLTTHAIPNSRSLLSRWHLPLGVVLHPLAETHDEEEVPVINFGSAGIIRCRSCRTYINPYATFTDAGRKWRCNLCSLLNDVPGEYFCALDASGRRCDFDQRPELSNGSVEFVASTENMVRPPMAPLYFFIIDVSVSAVRSGYLEIVAKTIKSCLDDLPGFPRTQIGFITFDSTLHFHNLKSSLIQPQMLVVADLDNLFLPLPDDLLVNLSESRHVVDAFLDSLPTMFLGSANMESALGPALKAAFMVMCQFGGKLLVFQSTLPSVGVGRLRLRGDDPRTYGTDKEHNLRLPEDPFYKQKAAEFTKTQISVDIYALSEKYLDIASLGSLAKYTGGQVYHYPFFQAVLHGEKLSFELARNLTRNTAWEAVMRIRCGKGVRFTTYHGHFMLRSTDLLALPAVDCDKAFAMQLALEESLMTSQTVYLQVALLYTSSSGERRIRVHTTAVPVVADLNEMYRQADTGAIVSLLGRLAIENSLSQKLEDARQSMQLKLVKSLKEYRNLYVMQHRVSGRLIFPESMKFLPLYVLCLCKSVALRGGYDHVPLDVQCASGYNMMILPINSMLKLLYPCLFRIDEILFKDPKEVHVPLKQLPLTSQSLDPNGIYILDDGFHFVLWLGRMVSSDIVNNILGVELTSFHDLSRIVLSKHDNDISTRLMKLMRELREKECSFYQLCRLVRQGEQPRELSMFLNNLMEDQIVGSSGYADWIVQIFKQLQNS